MSKNYGFVKVAAGTFTVEVANPQANGQEMEKIIARAAQQKVRVLAFAELSLTGYTCGDLFTSELLLQQTQRALATLLKNTSKLDIIFLVGLPVQAGAVLLDGAAVCYRGQILGVVPKANLSNFPGCGEARWFTPGLHWCASEVTLAGQVVPLGADLLFEAGGMSFGVEIGGAASRPSSLADGQGAEVIFRLSAVNGQVERYQNVCLEVCERSARNTCGYVYVSGSWGESSTDFVFEPMAFICENGRLLTQTKRFELVPQLICSEIDVARVKHERSLSAAFRQVAAQEVPVPYAVIPSKQPVLAVTKLERTISPTPFVPAGEKLDARCEEIFNLQVMGLATRLHNAAIKTAVIGISGGLDSTLALLVSVKAFDKLGLPRKQITGITMPGFGTTDRTYQNAIALMRALGITVREISIKAACEQHFKDIGHKISEHNVTYENAQARERTQVLMDVANQVGGMVVGTGDLSELALGWATYNGDHMAMYGVNAGIPKTLVRGVVAWVAKHQEGARVRPILQDILATPVSPELLPAKNGKIAQKTEDLVGPYELHDFFLYYFVRQGCTPEKIFFLAKQAFKNKFSAAEIKKWMGVFFRRFFTQQFKRSCMPDGPKVGSVGLSPRGDFKMASDAQAAAWLNAVENL